MEVLERTVGHIAIIQPQGRLVLSESHSDNLLKERVATLLREGRTHFAIDLVQVSQVDTSGLTALVAVHIAVRKQGARLALIGPPKRVRELLAVTRLNIFFDIFDSEAELIGAWTSVPSS